jgi:hypothetical protein
MDIKIVVFAAVILALASALTVGQSGMPSGNYILDIGRQGYSMDIVYFLLDVVFFALLFTSLFVFWQISRATRTSNIFKAPEFREGMQRLVLALYLIDLIFAIILIDFIYLRVAFGYVLPLELRVIVLVVAIATMGLLIKAMVYFTSPPGTKRKR